ncbi:glycosyltransferase family 2 protein [Planctomycetota bacterium]
MSSIMILIPAYNAAEFLESVVAQSLEWDLPVVVVDDGSSDATAEVAERAGATVVRHPSNMGKGKALSTGFQYAHDNEYAAVVTLDADGQHDPGEIGAFLEEHERSGADIVIGTRMRNVEGMPWLRRLVNRSSSFLVSKITGMRITDCQSGYRLVRTCAWQEVKPESPRFDAEPELLFGAAKRSFTITEVPIRTIYRDEAKSMISPPLDAWMFIKRAFKAMLDRRRASARRRIGTSS